jgi:Transmembrane exosortase (Exosortase_EpsH).
MSAAISAPAVSGDAGRGWLVWFALGALALWLVSRWAQVWLVHPELGHGWLVPLLTALLLRERWVDRPAVKLPTRNRAWWAWGLFALPIAAALAVSRLLLEPFPQWPLVLWVFSGLGYAVIFALLVAVGGGRFARHFAMPLVFSLTALPWPGIIDQHVILPLRAGLAVVAAEVANMLGHPAFVHGTAIEIGRGFVGVDEACSGVRSLQTAIAVSLFQGEWYRLTGRRRVALLGAGLAFALVTNLARTVFLSLQSAWHGPQGVERWHDSAGTWQLIVCLGGLLFVGWRWSRHGLPPVAVETATRVRNGAASRFAGAILGFVVAVEAGTQVWFNRGAREQRELPQWEVNLPAQRPDFKADPFRESMQRMLGCDAHQLGTWTADDGTARAGYVLEWNRGQTARFAPSLHDPTICLPHSGNALVAEHGWVDVAVGGLTLPFRAYTFSRGGTPYHVFYLAWDLTTHQPLQGGGETRGVFGWLAQQWEDVRAARRDIRARVIGMAIHGARDVGAARGALEVELGELARRER